MDITYLGHSCFKLRGKEAVLVTDPFSPSVGFAMAKVSADVVTVSHGHDDHRNLSALTGTARRVEPFVIDAPGEYEVSGVSVFGVRTFHDAKEGSERGGNTVFVISLDEVVVVHLGDLGHRLSDAQIEQIGDVDVLLVPVGGVYTIGPKEAVEVISQVAPSLVIPMHFRTAKHDQKSFASLSPVDDFLREGGFEQARRLEKLSLVKGGLPEEMEVVVLNEILVL